ncbi:rhamnulokinase [Halanaerobium salsuginis]|uniref:Rhamnulokinase n=1 Tax=Halanaerobium salsuginis TaxID=29563 RepID=A0A1I4JI75_9FIRM|nr:rhamnulokinase family protein [Halanaerobium salsuginis]SFL66269.1 rhamnulokinase [Halanaerobium salsuginis]
MNKQLTKVLACDLGASSGRSILGKFDGEKLTLDILHKFNNNGVYLNNNFHWNTLKQFVEIKNGIRKAIQKTNHNLASIGIDTWGVDYGLLDNTGSLMSVPFHYRDQRTNKTLSKVFKNISKQELYSETGIQIMQVNTIFQLYSELKERPWLLENAKDLLFTPDLLNYFLTGNKFNEATIASTSQLLNPLQRKWSSKIFNTLNLPQSIMQQIVFPGQKIGNINSKIKDELALQKDIPIIAVGSHDTASAIAATPIVDQNSVFLSSGTWSLLGIELDKPIISAKSLQKNFTNELGVGSKVTFLKNLTGLWLIQECKRAWKREGKNLSYKAINEAARKAKPFKYQIDTDHSSFINPANMPAAIKTYCKKTKQSVPEQPGEIARLIYESLAQKYKEVIQELEKLTDKKIKTINVVGGGTKSELLCQYTANITKRKVIAGPIEATAVGNILTQLIALGEIKDLKEGREIVKNSIDLKVYEPEELL